MAMNSKIIGAGEGGFLMLYCPPDRKARIRQSLGDAGLREMPYDFDFEGSKTMINF